MKTKHILVILIISLFWGCESLDTPLVDKESDLSFWDKPEDALNALNSCYPDLYGAEQFIFTESLSDNSYTKSNNGSLVRDVANGSYGTSASLIRDVWNARYAGIKRCNILLDNIGKVPGISAELKNRYIAEAKAIRAFHYFILMNNFGDVPLVTRQISIEESRTMPRTPKAEVLQFILNELDFAKTLPNSYQDSEKGRFTKGAAMALKARVLLCENRWQEVADICNAIINNKEAGNLDLFNGTYADLFKPENKDNIEVLLNVEFMPINREQGIQYYLIPPSLGGYAAISPSQELVDDYLLLNGKTIADPSYNELTPYANRDPRLDATVIRDGSKVENPDGSFSTINTNLGTGDDAINTSSNCTPTGYYVSKFYDKTARNMLNSGSNLILIRYADVLLMYAEAKSKLNQFGANEWNQTIKKLRLRAGFSNVNALDFPTVSNTEMDEIIRRERRSELAMEGLRLMDLRRWKSAEVVLNGWLHGIKTNEAPSIDNGYIRVDNRVFDKTKHYLWPVPQSERDLNSNLTQNPNW
ncbi:RagB/SusD family nutrient uptake outer membrane protein [Flavobacterium sp. 5]|uniref:RagB/SusD family nutrient uptake outer membrane protein n=1 Tax=Flavobacterium sp. 5 TaxID=2035199 RepID=UPI000C2BB452|nr:RagB/SusD family nutrient uptake outer membrane protein [Flavobacterium sp. 5]PKB18838.1 putative outer membrane starch-binding protein [Flavobacterium sp. 5]